MGFLRKPGGGAAHSKALLWASLSSSSSLAERCSLRELRSAVCNWQNAQMLYSIACWAQKQRKQSGSSDTGLEGPRADEMECFVSGVAEKTSLHTHYKFRDQLQ